MTFPPRPWLAGLLASLAVAGAQAADEYSFDAAAFEKKPFELGGFVQFKQEDSALNRDGAFYQLGYFGQPQRASLDRSTATVELTGKLRGGIGTFDFHSHSDLQSDQLGHAQSNVLYEAAYSLRPDPGITLEAGKRTLADH